MNNEKAHPTVGCSFYTYFLKPNPTPPISSKRRFCANKRDLIHISSFRYASHRKPFLGMKSAKEWAMK